MFRDIPDPFPLHVPLKTLPVAYRLVANMGERVATVLLSLMWGLGIPAVLIGYAQPFAPWSGADDAAGRGMALAALALFVVFGIGRWLGPTCLSVLRSQDVRITQTDVEVTEHLPWQTRRWTKPLAEFKGVARENWGTRSVGNDKIAVAALVLIHADPRYNLPLTIDGALRVKEASARRRAEQLGLPYLDGTRGQSGLAALPEGAILVNQMQALKVRGLYALLTGGGLAAAIAAAIAGWHAADPALMFVAALAAITAVAMHIFAGSYVTALASRADGDLDIATAAFLGQRWRLARSAVRSVAYKEGRGASGTPHAVHAPWVKLRVDGRYWPLIVDMQAEFVDEAALLSLGGMKGGATDPSQA